MDLFGRPVKARWSRLEERADVETLSTLAALLLRAGASAESSAESSAEFFSRYSLLHLVHRREPASSLLARLLQGESPASAVEAARASLAALSRAESLSGF